MTDEITEIPRERTLAAIPDPGKTEKPIKLPSVFDELKLADRFKNKNNVGGVFFSNLVSLPGTKDPNDPESEFFVCTTKHNCQYDQGPGINYNLFMFVKKNDEIAPVGNVDFYRIPSRDGNHVYMKDSGKLPKEVSSEIAKLPPHLQKAYAYLYRLNGDGYKIEALRVDEKYRDQKLGGLLWTLGLGYMEKEGINFVGEIGDTTVNKNPQGKSFYERYGAITTMVTRKQLMTGKPYEQKITMASTRPTPEQQLMMEKAFAINF